jgi:hypothetical protein
MTPLDFDRFEDLKPFLRFSARGKTDNEVLYFEEPEDKHLAAWEKIIKTQPDIFYEQLSWGMRHVGAAGLSSRKTEAMLEWRLRKSGSPLLIVELWAEDTPLANRKDRNVKDRLMRMSLEFKGATCTCSWGSFADQWPDVNGEMRDVKPDLLLKEFLIQSIPAMRHMGITKFVPFNKDSARDPLAVQTKPVWDKTRERLRDKFDSVVRLQEDRGYPLSPAIKRRVSTALGTNPLKIFDVAATGYSIAHPDHDASDRHSPRVKLGDYLLDGEGSGGHYPLANTKWLQKLGSPISLKSASRRFAERQRLGKVPTREALEKALRDIDDAFSSEMQELWKRTDDFRKNVGMLLGKWRMYTPDHSEIVHTLRDGADIYVHAVSELEANDPERYGRQIALESVARTTRSIFARVEVQTGHNPLFCNAHKREEMLDIIARDLSAHYKQNSALKPTANHKPKP